MTGMTADVEKRVLLWLGREQKRTKMDIWKAKERKARPEEIGNLQNKSGVLDELFWLVMGPAAPWHAYPAETPAPGDMVLVRVPSALLYWNRYQYAEYRHSTFWRGAERVDGVTAWAPVKEDDA